MTAIEIGCQTFTWEMLAQGWSGTTDDILDAVAAAGYAGIEITDAMIGPYASRPEAFAGALADRGLTLVAFAWVSPTGFTVASEATADAERARPWLDFVARFPAAVLSLGSATAHAGGPVEPAIDCAAGIYDAIAGQGRAAGVAVAFHPSSHPGSVLTTAADYARMMAATDPSLLAWVPDTGHILKGGMDVAATLARYRDRIAYVHLKDAAADGTWRMMGDGDVGIVDLVAGLRDDLAFSGWLVAEEESDEAGRDPAAAVLRNHRFLQGLVGGARS